VSRAKAASHVLPEIIPTGTPPPVVKPRARRAGKWSPISKYENSKELPKLESLERVLAALGVGYFEFFRTLDVIDRGETSAPPLTREEIDERFTRLTQGVFALHREIIMKLTDCC
jgi:hypothetical protein